jgi:mannose-6-phosphate isomerase-like protein (cupin superfamily)
MLNRCYWKGMKESCEHAASTLTRAVKHRHLVQDEILLVQSGTAHVWLGDQQRDLHAGGLVFIPANTWISAKNIGTEPVSLTFIFSSPEFEDTMRCNSVPAGETPTEIMAEQQKECAHLGHA